MSKLFTVYGRPRVRVRLAPTWFLGYQTTRHYLPVGSGGVTIALFLLPFIVVTITI